MGKSLYIAEKPSVAQEFARALHVNGVRKDGYLESEDSVVTWCVGHLVSMSYPEVYDEKYRRWSLATLPFIPEKFLYEVIPSVKKQFQIDIEDDEIGYVALHIHSAIEDEKVSQAMQMARSVRECISMVEEAIGKPIDIASLSYNRLMNHIRYMVARALNGEKLKVNMNDYMEVKFPESFGMAQVICDQVGTSLGVKLEEVETGYLAMHIERVANDEREIEE